MTDKEYIDLCIEMAKENVISGNGGPFAAIVIKDGQIVGKGFNLVTTNKEDYLDKHFFEIRRKPEEIFKRHQES